MIVRGSKRAPGGRVGGLGGPRGSPGVKGGIGRFDGSSDLLGSLGDIEDLRRSRRTFWG